MCRNEANIHEKSASELNQKRCLKTELKKQKKTQKLTQKWLHKNERILGEMPIGAPLVLQTVFVMKKLAPSAPFLRPAHLEGATCHPTCVRRCPARPKAQETEHVHLEFHGLSVPGRAGIDASQGPPSRRKLTQTSARARKAPPRG